MAIEVDALALKADQRFQELSQEIDNLPESDFEKDWKSHIIASGGTTDPKEIKKHKSKTQAKEKKTTRKKTKTKQTKIRTKKKETKKKMKTENLKTVTEIKKIRTQTRTKENQGLSLEKCLHNK